MSFLGRKCYLGRIGHFAGYDMLWSPINAGVGSDSNVSDAKFVVENDRWTLYIFFRERHIAIGISEYELAKQQLPKEMQTALPTAEEIENELYKQQPK